ncbi:MAG: hypothetical protein IJ343_14155 [Clostridia bacterium]|nr:hypothetical protein [Clostridia bacterium]
MKEFFRKRMVALKRKPQTIAMVVLGVAFVYYSLNLTHVSNTTAYIQGAGMGLSAFVIMLFSVLALVCFMNAFPHRKKVNVPMLLLMFAMLGGVFFCDTYYTSRIDNKLSSVRAEAVTEYLAENPEQQAEAEKAGEQAVAQFCVDHPSVPAAKSMLGVHGGILLSGVLLVALLPVYTPLIRKVKTSVEVEANEDMGEIELDGSDE